MAAGLAAHRLSERMSTNSDARQRGKRHRTMLVAVSLLALAFVAGLPALRGGFLTGDDYHLVRNHVLVNHPSLAHALKLFTIVHRDLYQPVPLLSFSIDFAIIRALGLQPVAEGPRAGAWVFHLANICLHALNTLLVFWATRRLSGRLAVAGIAAGIFAVHPYASETIAWINGRMMLLSTCFTLAALIALDRWRERPGWPRGLLTVLFGLLAHISKVSIALPVLALVYPLAQRRWPRRGWWALWAALAVMTAGFTLFAISSSGQMFEEAEEEMPGPPAFYAVLALGQYFRQYVMPIGLSPWYPPPAEVNWSGPLFIASAATVLLVVALVLLSLRRSRVGVAGLLWFLAAVAPTLPIVPARRALAADRYVYLPNVGIHWIVASVVVAGFVYVSRRSPGGRRWNAPTVLLGAACVGAGGALLGTLWKVQAYYRDNLAVAHRIIQCFPRYPTVYESAAWAYYREGHYEEAISVALKDLEFHPEKMACEVYQVVGMSQFRLGRYEEALASLRKAIEADPAYGKCYTRIAQIYAELGRYDEAIENYRRGIEIMPYYNPGLLNLAAVYRSVGRVEDAVSTYEQVLVGNAYDVTAHLALAEIGLGRGNYAEAASRLETLLAWMPENTVARTNLGLSYEALNRPDDALDAYWTAIERDPNAVVAISNLASLYVRTDRADQARRLLEAHLPQHETDLTLLIAYHDVVVHMGRPDAAAAPFMRAARLRPDDGGINAWAAYTLSQAGQTDEASELLQRGAGDASSSPVVLLAKTLLALDQNVPEAAIADVRALLALDAATLRDAGNRLIDDLARYSLTHPADPWPFYLSAMVLVAQGRTDVARMALEEFRRLCPTPDCESRAAALLPEPADP